MRFRFSAQIKKGQKEAGAAEEVCVSKIVKNPHMCINDPTNHWGFIMKYTSILLAFFLFILPISAEESQPYDQMSYEELLQVDQSALSKTEKKAFKKAYRTAKKAEKKRKKAEAKRRKAEEKARKKRQKLAQKKLKKLEKAYQKTRLTKDDFESSYKVRGAEQVNYSSAGNAVGSLFSAYSPTKYFLRSSVYPAKDYFFIQVYITRRFAMKIPQENLNALAISPEEYARRKGWWADYNRASLKGGKVRKLRPITRSSDTCYGICYFNEELAVSLEAQDLLDAINGNTDLQVKVYSPKEPAFILNVNRDYMMGFLMRLSEMDSDLTYLGDPGRKFRASVMQEVGD